MNCEFVFTCQTDSEQLCLNEMQKITGVKLIKWLDGGVGLAECDMDFTEFSKTIRAGKPVFLRHIFPAGFVCGYAGDVIEQYKNKIDKNTSMSVQVRAKTGEKPEFDIANYFKENGYLYNKAAPEVIISVFISGGKIYSGLSKSIENLSSWPGGMRHYAFDGSVISRAEFKLLELFEYFPDILNNQNENTALDLGASPGGWTKILAQKGYRVTAVDPNKLSDMLRGNKNVEYHKCLAEDFIKSLDKKYDLIVNDMRMHAVESAKLMVEAHKNLKENGYAVVTLKLSKRDKSATIKNGLDILRKKYEVLFVKQLFHNRSEITVVLRKF